MCFFLTDLAVWRQIAICSLFSCRTHLPSRGLARESTTHLCWVFSNPKGESLAKRGESEGTTVYAPCGWRTNRVGLLRSHAGSRLSFDYTFSWNLTVSYDYSLSPILMKTSILNVFREDIANSERADSVGK